MLNLNGIWDLEPKEECGIRKVEADVPGDVLLVEGDALPHQGLAHRVQVKEVEEGLPPPPARHRHVGKP